MSLLLMLVGAFISLEICMTLSIATIGNSSTIYIRNVLRNLLTDRQSPVRPGSSWIFKSMPAEREFDPPIVVVRLDGEARSKLSLNEAKKTKPTLIFDIRVWAGKIVDRDVLADQIISVLSTNTSTDGTSTIKQNYLVYIDSSQVEEDGYIGDRPDLIRIKRIRSTFRFIGV